MNDCQVLIGSKDRFGIKFLLVFGVRITSFCASGGPEWLSVAVTGC